MPILPEPTWGTPTKSYGEQSALCIIKPSPHVVMGLLIQLLKAHFADPDNIVDPKLKEYVWVDDNTEGHIIDSRINIIPSYKFEPATVQQRPSINVTRGVINNEEFIISNGPAPHMDQYTGNFEGELKYTLIVGQHIIECCGNKPAEADRIAEEVFFRMIEYKSVIKEDLNFSEFDVKVLNRLEEVNENHQHWKAPVVISWKYVYSWYVKPVSPVLKEIGQVFNLE